MRILLSIFGTLSLINLPAQVSYDSSYVAGSEITITMEQEVEDALLMIEHSYGSALVSGEKSAGITKFKVPPVVAKKTGVLDLKVISKRKTIWNGSTLIITDSEGPRSIESYCGPKHLVVAINDFSMLTTTVLDQHDNPYPVSTVVSVRSLVENSISSEEIVSDGLTAHVRIYAPQKSGNGAVSAVYQNVSSKEFRLDFYPNDPENYSLSHSKQHVYADGNQLVKISTSEIKDRFGNQIDNGTLVYFQLRSSNGLMTSATASTINGVAQLEIPAPNYQTDWQVSSIIPNYAKSSEIIIAFKRSILELLVSAKKKQLIIGPVKSFLGQVAKEGMLVSVVLENQDRSIEFDLPLKAGFATLNYANRLVPAGEYQATIQLGDLEEKIAINVPIHE